MARVFLNFSVPRIAVLVWTVLVVLLLGACGLVSTRSVYEGFRTQQRIKDAGSQAAPDTLGSYDGYEKERAKAKSMSVPPETP
jgi:hypothetical protein